MTPGIVVVPGQIVVNQICAHVVTPDVIILEVDCASKYPDVVGYGDTSVFLGSGDRTLYAEPVESYTEIRVVIDGVWGTMASAGRYAVSIALWRAAPTPVLAWSSPDLESPTGEKDVDHADPDA